MQFVYDFVSMIILCFVCVLTVSQQCESVLYVVVFEIAKSICVSLLCVQCQPEQNYELTVEKWFLKKLISWTKGCRELHCKNAKRKRILKTLRSPKCEFFLISILTQNCKSYSSLTKTCVKKFCENSSSDV